MLRFPRLFRRLKRKAYSFKYICKYFCETLWYTPRIPFFARPQKPSMVFVCASPDT